MSKVRVHNFTISLDGYGTGEGQSIEAPFGHGGHIMDWFKKTRTFNEMIGQPENGETGIDDDFAKAWGESEIGCEIMGRNKFTPERGPWLDENWKGWGGRRTTISYSVHCAHAPQKRTARYGRNNILFYGCFTSRSTR